MRTLQNYFDEYSVSHQNENNQIIHYFCVPAIFFSIIGLIMCIPTPSFLNFTNDLIPFIENWAFLVIILILIFYFRLSIKVGFQIAIFAIGCLFLNYQIGQKLNLLIFSVGIFAIAWILQFWGHKIEGKKPSFLKDIQFLLIGPAWVIHSLFNKK